jgi:hypothetical protein
VVQIPNHQKNGEEEKDEAQNLHLLRSEQELENIIGLGSSGCPPASNRHHLGTHGFKPTLIIS